ncbi:hypothetical protein V6N12_033161 [Hibiscus sabdariffa]|uniref:Uncharacterized protein n=1 Tax=Hibiscus sabdariffa TaxID=183260 RepID=A0ABR2BDC7_9ROSI
MAKKWETIQLEELKIKKDEATVVNCLYGLKNLPHDIVASTSATDTNLKLIRSINPELFIHGVANKTYSAPFFVTRVQAGSMNQELVKKVTDKVRSSYDGRWMLQGWKGESY